MKPLDYVKKYSLDKGVNFNHSEFVQDLTFDFVSLLEIGKNKNNEFVLSGFENTVRAIRQKWDGINNKTLGQLPDKLWNYFYASVVVKMRGELFPIEMEKRRIQKEERERRKKEFDERKFGIYDWYSSLLLSFLGSIKSKPVESFIKLGLNDNATIDEVKSAYRGLSKIHHPDTGGKQQDFLEITEAKNKCLAFLQ
jgi:hypothetical protein